MRVAFATASSQDSEKTTTVLLLVVLSATAIQPVTVNYAVTGGTATQGGDYTLTNGTLTFSPGQTSQTITVRVINDTQPEPNETFYLTLSQPTNAELGAVTVHTHTILDDEQLPVPVAAGDANRDFQFDQLDIVQVLQGAKHLLEGQRHSRRETGTATERRPAGYRGVLQSGNYLQGPYEIGVRS